MSQKLNACVQYQRKSTSVRKPAKCLSQLYSGQQEHFYRYQYQRHEGQEKHFVICASSLRPTPPFCDVQKGEVLH